MNNTHANTTTTSSSSSSERKEFTLENIMGSILKNNNNNNNQNLMSNIMSDTDTSYDSDSDTDTVSSYSSLDSSSPLFDVGNDFARVENDAWNQDLFCQRRVPIHVLVYDEDGTGHAASVVDWLSRRNRNANNSYLTVQRIQGGIEAFFKEFPLLDKRKRLHTYCLNTAVN
jgi:hypothetical protein